MPEQTQSQKHTFTGYQKFMIAVLSFISFTVILDFMVIAPLGAQLNRILGIAPSQFGLVVSAYGISAAISGILSAGFADKFDRKNLLLFFYTGFIAGTLLCGIAPGYWSLLAARIVSGVFGGVMGSISMAIIADIFELKTRGRVMGFVQMAFAASQVAGLPLGLFLADKFNWHAPFLLIVGISVVAWLIIARFMKPVNEHLKTKIEHHAFVHLWNTVKQERYLKAFATTIFLSTGGFLIMPFSTTFYVNNVGIKESQLPALYVVAGLAGLFLGPMIGKLSDKLGKYKIFLFGTILSTVMVLITTHLTITPLWVVMILNMFMFVAISSRMIPTQALISAIPDLKDRGAFMSINASVQQMAGGFASMAGGMIIYQAADKKLIHYDTLGYIVIVTFALSATGMYFIQQYVHKKAAAAVPHQAVKVEEPVETIISEM
jgi:predicted MFS family arabinose efflux permease